MTAPERREDAERAASRLRAAVDQLNEALHLLHGVDDGLAQQVARRIVDVRGCESDVRVWLTDHEALNG